MGLGRGKFLTIETKYVGTLTGISQYWEGVWTDKLFVWGRGEGGSQFWGGGGVNWYSYFSETFTSHFEG